MAIHFRSLRGPTGPAALTFGDDSRDCCPRDSRPDKAWTLGSEPRHLEKLYPTAREILPPMRQRHRRRDRHAIKADAGPRGGRVWRTEGMRSSDGMYHFLGLIGARLQRSPRNVIWPANRPSVHGPVASLAVSISAFPAPWAMQGRCSIRKRRPHPLSTRPALSHHRPSRRPCTAYVMGGILATGSWRPRLPHRSCSKSNLIARRFTATASPSDTRGSPKHLGRSDGGATKGSMMWIRWRPSPNDVSRLI